jgi:hypothetical protein
VPVNYLHYQAEARKEVINVSIIEAITRFKKGTLK